MAARVRAPVAKHLSMDETTASVTAASPAGGRPEASADGVDTPSGVAEPAAKLAPLEAALAGLWANLLQVGSVPRDADFFLLGGDSLRGATLVGQVRALFGVDIGVPALFEQAGTVAGMARIIDAERRRVRSAPDAGARRASLPRRSDARAAPLSRQQARVWFLHRLDPASDAYHESTAWRIEGPLDAGALDRALARVADRQAILRTRYVANGGEPRQVVDARPTWSLEIVDLRAAADPEAALATAIAERVRRPFDFAAGAPVRFALFRTGPDRHALVRVWHHIASDGLSNPLFHAELSDAYAVESEGRAPSLAPIAFDYGDYAAWQQGALDGAAARAALDRWRLRLSDLPSIDLPADLARPPAPSFRGSVVTRTWERERAATLKALAREHGATPFMAFLAAFEVLLSRLSGSVDFAIGTPVGGRTQPEFAPLIGFFANTLAIRADLSGDPDFIAVLARTRARVTEALDDQEVPFERLVDALGSARDPSRNPLFQIAFGMRETGTRELVLGGARVVRDRLRFDHAKFDLTLTLLDEPDRLLAHWEYATDLFRRETVERMAGQFERLIEAIAADPGAPVRSLPMMDSATRTRLVVDTNRTARPYPDAVSVHAHVADVAARRPDAVAVGALTYGMLDSGANRLAQSLRAAGVRRGSRVAVSHARAEDVALSWLAVLKAGGAYVPVDPEWPAERIAFLFDDAGIAQLVADDILAIRLSRAGVRTISPERDRAAIAALPDRAPDDSAGPGDPAYVIYTSGSTGTPKGVVVPHRAVLRLVCGTDYVRIAGDDRVAQLASPAFDASTFEFWGALCNGARMVPIAKATAVSPRAFAASLAAGQVTALFVTSALFNATVREVPAAFAGCRDVIVGGEAVDPRSVRLAQLATPDVRFVNGYGPTETTTFAVCHPIGRVDADDASVPLGRPIANTTAYVLRPDGEPCAPGEPGELWIGGPGVAIGYLGRPELTAERFVEREIAPAPRARLYRTGDRARWREDGAIEFLGRSDRQVKLRGHRIELDEVESALARLPQVREAVVEIRGDSAESRQLVAWLVATDPTSPPPENLARDLRRRLPEPMIPGAFVWLPAMPLNANGKIDRRALPPPGASVQGAAGLRVPPRDMFEGVLLRIWENVLGTTGLGVLDRFFEVGGHSLLAAKLVDAVERETGCAVPLTAMFADDTVAGMARVLREGSPPSDAPIVVVREGGARPPFVFLHGDFQAGGFYSRNLALALGPDQPALVVHPHGLADTRVPDTIEAMAAERVDALVRARPSDTYVLGGHCNGALVAYEMARELEARGHRVPLVVLIEANAPHARMAGAEDGVERFVKVGAGGAAEILSARDRASEVDLRFRRAIDRYRGTPWQGRVAVVLAAARERGGGDGGWSRLASHVEAHRVPGDHVTLITRHMAELAATVRAAVDRALART